MARSDTRTRIAAIIEADKTTLGLTSVERFIPETSANWELPILFVVGTTESARIAQHEKNLLRTQTWTLRILYQIVGHGWSADLQDKQDDLIDALFTLLNGNPVLRLNDAGLPGVDQVQWGGATIITPYSFPVNQREKMYHAVDMNLLVLYSQLCQR
jgi:hypothetical protein